LHYRLTAALVHSPVGNFWPSERTS